MQKEIFSFDRKIFFKTARLSVSTFTPQDIDGFMSYRNDADWMKYQGFKCLSREEYCSVLLTEPDFSAGVQLAVLLSDRDTLIGDLYVKIDQGIAEIGYALNKQHTGKGYCTEAVSGLCGYLKGLKVSRVKAEVDRNNTASIRVLDRTGFIYQGEDDGYLIYRKAV